MAAAFLARMVLAATFLFSGFVKAVDPLGMSYKLNAYFAHWGVALPEGSLWLLGAVAALATVEFLLGVYLLLGMRRRVTAACVFAFMFVMTALTAYILAVNPVPDCGCFGEAVVLSNEATFGKNVVLLALAAYLMFFGPVPVRLVSERNQWITSIYSFCYIVLLSILSAHYLPVLDFTPYKVGADIPAAMAGQMRTRFVYERDGRREVFDEDHLPGEPWKFVETQTEIIEEPVMADFVLFSKDGDDVTADILATEGYLFLLTLPSVESADDGNTDRINDIYDYCRDGDIPFYAVTASGDSLYGTWVDRTGAAYPMLRSEAEVLKAMVRSNPGLMLLHGGRIVGKWSHNRLPGELGVTETVERLEQSQQAGVLAPWLRLLLYFVVPFAVFVFADRT